MQYIEQVAALKITANATLLATTIDNSETALVFSAAVFEASDVITIGGETITLGSTSDNLTFTGCTRGTPAESHAAGQEAFLAAGQELLSHTFDGNEYFNALSASANIEITLGVALAGVVQERVRLTSYNLSWFRPFHREQPTNGTVWSIVTWLRADVGVETEASGSFQA